MLDHLPDRHKLPSIASDRTRAEPVKTEVLVVLLGLLGIKQHESLLAGHPAPATALVVLNGRLQATVQHNHERWWFPPQRRHEFQHAQASRIAPEAVDLDQRSAGRRRAFSRFRRRLGLVSQANERKRILDQLAPAALALQEGRERIFEAHGGVSFGSGQLECNAAAQQHQHAGRNSGCPGEEERNFAGISRKRLVGAAGFELYMGSMLFRIDGPSRTDGRRKDRH